MKNQLYLNCGRGFSPLPGSKFCAPSPFRPRIDSITPSTGATQGGELAVVRGLLGADPNGKVTIGGMPCDIFVQSSIGTWLCFTPPGNSPAGEVILSNFGRTSLVLAGDPEPSYDFDYALPRLDTIHPQYIGDPSSNSIMLTVTGENFGMIQEHIHPRILSLIHI